MTLIMSLQKIKKDFSGVVVLDDIDFEIETGRVYSLAGENGAGKSTLCNIIVGSLSPSAGKICLSDETQYDHLNIKQVKNLGVRMVHQELQTLPDMSAAENLFVGSERHWFGFIRQKEMNAEASKILASVGLNVDPKVYVKNLDIASRQLLEIAKAISGEARLIILDEPTSSLSEAEAERLFSLIRHYREKGTSFIFISHRIEEILEISDEIIVLKDGRITAHFGNDGVTAEDIISKMVGRSYDDLYFRKRECFGDEVLSVENLSSIYDGIRNNAYQPQQINFSLNAGEVLGLSGLVGAGRTEILRMLFGDLPKTRESHIRLDHSEVQINSPSDAIEHGMAWVTEDRKQQGVILDFPIRDNIALPNMNKVSNGIFVSRQKETNLAEENVSKLSIRTTGIMQRLKFLSGGNQQKVVLAKWLTASPRVLLLDEPTRGIDVGAKTEIYKLINQLTNQGVAVLLVSSELPEIMGISDRIIVIHEGRIASEFSRDQFSEEKIMTCATGRKLDA